MSTEIINGDCRTVLPALAADRFRCCVTSVPYWEQREYLPADHPNKAREIGHEPTPAAYVETLVGVFREVRRVLASDGTLWVNIGQKRAVRWGSIRSGRKGFDDVPRERSGKVPSGLKEKDLVPIAWMLGIALQQDGWWLRSDVIWHKPNAIPEGNVHDRPTTDHEYVLLFSKSQNYFYDIDSTREPHTSRPQRRHVPHKASARPGQPLQTFAGSARSEPGFDGHAMGRNARTVWSIDTERSDGEHTAPMPSALARRCVLAGSKMGDAILDPFGGSGTVGRVAEEEGRGAVLIDLDERACLCAKGRTAQRGLFAKGAA